MKKHCETIWTAESGLRLLNDKPEVGRDGKISVLPATCTRNELAELALAIMDCLGLSIDEKLRARLNYDFTGEAES